ncbi:hypothetical protein LUU34_00328200 [Aix galericulata]|nr:hypothetical protein LUU34_00328200 [Aix galericulata]
MEGGRGVLLLPLWGCGRELQSAHPGASGCDHLVFPVKATSGEAQPSEPSNLWQSCFSACQSQTAAGCTVDRTCGVSTAKYLTEAPKSKVVLVSDQSQTGQWTFSGYAPLRSSAVEFSKVEGVAVYAIPPTSYASLLLPLGSSKMGGKLSKKKKGYSVNDEKAKDKDKKAEGAAAEEEETPKEAEDAQQTTETTEVKENNKEEKGEKDSQVAANKTEEKEGEKEKTVTQEETQKAEPEKSEAVVDAKVEPQKNNEQAPKQEEPTAASAPAASSEAPKTSEPSSDAKVSQPSEATAPSKADDKSKEEGEAKKTEAPATPAAQETKSEVAPASDSKPSSSEAAPSSKESAAATAAPSSTAKASDPAAPPEESGSDLFKDFCFHYCEYYKADDKVSLVAKYFHRKHLKAKGSAFDSLCLQGGVRSMTASGISERNSLNLDFLKGQKMGQTSSSLLPISLLYMDKILHTPSNKTHTWTKAQSRLRRRTRWKRGDENLKCDPLIILFSRMFHCLILIEVDFLLLLSNNTPYLVGLSCSRYLEHKTDFQIYFKARIIVKDNQF